jgi:predicted nuclease of predicted toxin-antitoxin system
VKLLLDQNLSHRLVESLRGLFPEVVHVRAIGLAEATDHAVWEFASDRGFTIVTKDGDFSGHAFLFGPSPKVVWIQLGNCTTAAIEELLRAHRTDLETFHEDAEAGLLVLP